MRYVSRSAKILRCYRFFICHLPSAIFHMSLRAAAFINDQCQITNGKWKIECAAKLPLGCLNIITQRRVALTLMLALLLSGMCLPGYSHTQTVLAVGQPILPGVNGRIAFTSERNGNAEIYTMNPDGSGPMNLTNNPAEDVTPAWSYDGTKIAFASNRDQTYSKAPRNIYVMDADGSNLRRVTRNEIGIDTRFYDPAWSPDGTKIVFVNSFMGEISRLAIINADGTGGLQNIDQASTEVADPEWSPDGSRIAFIARESAATPEEALNFYLYVINANGSGKTKLSDKPAFITGRTFPSIFTGPTWSPDGSKIAYAGSRDGNAEIYVIDVGSQNQMRLTNNSAHDFHPTWSPDGTKIAFTSERDSNREIYVMNADGTNQTRLSTSAAPDYDPNWQSAGPRTTLPQPSVLQFNAAIYQRSELDRDGTPVAAITVTRLGDLAGEASVDYLTSDGTASERSDYTMASGRLRFASGQPSQSFYVSIINDAFVEGNETVDLRLLNARGALLGSQERAVLIITDDDIAPPVSNPIDEASIFVRQHYLDFLNREPDIPGWNYWSTKISQCGADANCIDRERVNVSAAFFVEQEFQRTSSFLLRCYRASFGRQPLYAEYIHDRNRLIEGSELEATKQAFAQDFVERTNFLTKYPLSLSCSEFVDALLKTVKDTTGVDLSDQRSAYLNDCNASNYRVRILRSVVDDPRFAQAEYNGAFVQAEYFSFLRRDPDEPGYQFWLEALNNRERNNYRGMVCAFLTSAEYQERFSPVRTRTNRLCANIGP